jgi:glycine/D-amino acid oxidase-like deaminating enzyme
LDYGDDEVYMELMEIALERWERFNADLANGEEIYHGDGILLLLHSDLSRTKFANGSFQTLKKRGHTAEELSKEDIQKRFRQWNTAKVTGGYWNPKGGWVESGKVVSIYARLALAIGVKIVRDQMRSLLLDKTESRCRGVIGENNRRYEADCVLVAAGAWTPVLLPHLRPVMWPTGQMVHHFMPPKEESSKWLPPAFPPYLSVGDTGFYGFPAHYPTDGRVKIGHHGRGIPLQTLTAEVIKEALTSNQASSEKAFRKFISEHIPALATAPCVFSRVCLYCDSYDGDFWIDRDQKYEGLFVAAGDSGHGFKFATVFGDIISDVIEDKPNKFRAKFAARDPKTRPALTEAARSQGSAEDDVGSTQSIRAKY